MEGYSIFNKGNKALKNKADIDKIYKKTKSSTYYFAAVAAFLFVMFIICISPEIFGKTYDYSTVKVNDIENITSTLDLEVDDLELNKEDGLFKIILHFKSEQAQAKLSNLKCDYKLNFITNKKNNSACAKVIKVSDEYTVIYYKNLPKNFGVISLEIRPSYIYPQIEQTNDLKDKCIKFYAVDGKIKENNNLEIKSLSDLKEDNYKLKIKAIKDQIASENKSINTLTISNKMLKEEITKAQDNLKYQTVDEQANAKNNIDSIQSDIDNNLVKINECKKKIQEYNDKISQLSSESFNYR